VVAAALTTPILSRFDFTHLPRPVIPLDEVTAAVPPARIVSTGK